MSNKKKIFIIAYVIVLISVATFMLNKIFAAGDSADQSSGEVKYAGYEAKETGTPKTELLVTGEGANGEGYVADKAHNVGYMHEDLQNNDDVYCFDGNKTLFVRSTLFEQKIARTNSVDYTGYHYSESYVVTGLSPETNVYPPSWTRTKFSLGSFRHFCSMVVDLSVLQISRYDTSVAESYILSQKNEPKYQQTYEREGFMYNARQFAIWELKNGSGSSYVSGKSAAEELYTKAMQFQDFRTNFKLPKLDSNSADYKFKYNVGGDYFIAGPITMDYPKLVLDSGLVVGKITSSKLYGKNSDGTENIEVPFEITDASGAPKAFPTTGGQFTFYIKVANSTVKSQKIREITDYKVNFEYLDATGYGYEVTDPSGTGIKYYEWEQVADHGNCYVMHGTTKTYVGRCYEGNDRDYCDNSDCSMLHTVHHDAYYQLQRESGYSGTREIQPLFIFGEAELFWRQYELKITFEKGQQTYIDIGGKVWIDNQDGSKENEENKVFDNGEYGRPNVLVKLYFWDGTPVAVGVNGVIADERNTGFSGNYELYTDSSGEYKFYGLPIDQKYYVEFTYDGTTYTRVEYLAGGSEGDYLSNPNQEKYDINSKVKEENDRDGFNKRFETITYVGIGQRSQFVTSSGREDGTTGIASGASQRLNYLTRKSYENGKTYNKSKILTTNEYSDVDTDKAKGVSIDPHQITARTGENLRYPFEQGGEILIWSADSAYTSLEGNALHYLDYVNLGLRIREKADFALTTQIKAGAMTIKDKEKVVFYSSLASDEDLEIDGTATQDEYIKQEISASDYYWKENFEKIYGADGNTYYVLDEDRLNVYVLYRIVIKDQCEDANDYGIIKEVIDHYDNRLERVTNNKELSKASALFREKGLNVPAGAVESWVEGTNTLVNWRETTPLNSKYTTMRTEGLNLEVGKDKSTSAIYLILKVKENGDVLNTGTDSNTDGIQNIAEIGKYSVYNKDGSVVGKIDKDSAPGNATPGQKETYEDDTDAAPMFRLEMNWAPRKIEGNVWDDINKDGVMNDGSGKGIENVTVKLIEYITNEEGTVTDIIERPGIEINGTTLTVDRNQHVKTDKNGHYEFYVEGGNYALKFIYGNTEMLYGVSANKKYNAQDYQATKYSALSSGSVNGYNTSSAIPNPNAFATEEQLEYAFKNNLISNKLVTDDIDIINKDKAHSTWETTHWKNDTTNNLSSARDDANIRANIIQNTNSLQYNIASVLDELNVDVYGNKAVSSRDIARQLSGNDNTTTNYTYIESDTDIIIIASNDLVGTSKVINLGLKERPLASRALEKTVKRIVLKTNDGTALIDTSDASKLSGVQKLNDIQDTYINMDSNLLDGATLDIDYEIVVKNDSPENDTLRNYMYVASDEAKLSRLGSLDTPLPIRATVFDYVNINLEYRAADNIVAEGTSGWAKVYDNDSNTNSIAQGWLSSEVEARLPRTQKYVSKVMSTKTSDLLAGQSVVIPIHLGITLSENTGKNDVNDFDFSNCAEVVQVDSPAGRRDYETIPGNYEPYEKPSEIDESLTGRTAISPPLGQERIYYVIAIVSAVIVIVGVILIKKKVLKK